MEGRFATSRHLCGPNDFVDRLEVLLFFPHGKWELSRPKRNFLASDSLRRVLTANESVSSFRFTFPKFVLDLHLPSTHLSAVPCHLPYYAVYF